MDIAAIGRQFDLDGQQTQVAFGVAALVIGQFAKRTAGAAIPVTGALRTTC